MGSWTLGGQGAMGVWGSHTKPNPSGFPDQSHLVLLAQMVADLLRSQSVCFDRWKTVLPLGHCLASSWQRRAQRWLSNERIEVEALYGPLILWALQHWQKPGQSLHLAIDTTML